jgi:uncharacterized protein
MRHWPWRLAGLLTLVWLALSPACAGADPTFPQLTGRVVDDAGLLSPAQRSALSDQLAALESKSSDQVVVVTLPSLQGYSIEDYGYQLGRHWGIGTKKLNNGVLLIVAPKEHKVRIEVGYGLEPILTDALSSVIIQEAILPKFRQGDFAGGIQAGVGDILKVLTGDSAELAERAKARETETKQPEVDWATVIIWILIILWLIYVFRNSAGGGRGRGGGVGPVIFPGPGWGGGFSGGGFSGGGFSGGGGSFGGGGASGSW